MSQSTYLLSFDNVSPVEASRHAADLRNWLLDASDELSVQRQRDAIDTQDMGATLVVGVLGAPAVVTVAKAIGDYLMRHHRITITVKGPDGTTLEASGLTPDLAKHLTEWLFSHR